MKTIITILLLTLTSCYNMQFVERLEYPYNRIANKNYVYASQVDTIKPWKFEPRNKVTIKFFTYNNEYRYSYVTFDTVHVGDTLPVTPEMLAKINIKRIKD